MDVVEAHEQALTEYAYGVLSGIDGVTQYGPKPPNRAGILASTSATCTPTTSPRCSTPRASPSAPATTARSP